MKKFILLFCSLLCAAAVFPVQKVVILNFKNVNIEKDIADAVTEILSTTIVEENIFSVIERAQLDKILNELKLTTSDDFDDNEALEVGKLAKADTVLIGSVTKLGENISINIRGIEVSTGNVQFGKKISTDNIDFLEEAAEKLAISLNKDYSPDNISEKKTESLERDSTGSIFIDNKEAKFAYSNDNFRVNRKIPALTKLLLVPTLNDIEIKSVVVEFRDGTETPFYDTIEIEEGEQKELTISSRPTTVKKIKITYKTVRKRTKSWAKCDLRVYGK